jgi:subtilisin family serine protease
LSILSLFLLVVAGILVSPNQPPAQAGTSVDAAVLSDLKTASDGQATFFVLLAEQADLSAATTIKDWQAKGRWVFQTLTSTAHRSQSSLRNKLTRDSLAGHVSHWQPFWIVNAIAVRGDSRAVATLARQPEVARILPEIKLEPPAVSLTNPDQAAKTSPTSPEWNVAQINADDVWALGYTGTGMILANVDTGVDYTHPALVRQYRGNLGQESNGPFQHDYNWFDPFWGTLAPQALPWQANGTIPSGHGTHVMGTATGSDGADNEIGVAPGARWIAAFGCCPDNESLLAALQWHLAPTALDGSNPNPDLRPHALQNSWGGPGGSLIFGQALATLKAAGIFVSASAGNNGGPCGTLGSPGDNPEVFNVGGTTAGNGLYLLSSRGPNPFTGQTGPEVVAPGAWVRSAYPGDQYVSSSGTSMAGPHAIGAVALLWDANPALIGRVDYTAEILRKTATPLFVAGEVCAGVDSGTEHPNNSAGWGQIDVLRALQVVGRGQSRLLVTVTDDLGQPLPGATIKLHKPHAELGTITLQGTADVQGRFEFLVSPGPVTVQAELFGYKKASATAVVAFVTHLPLVLGSNTSPTTGATVAASFPATVSYSLADLPPQASLTMSPSTAITVRGLVHQSGDPNLPLAAKVSEPNAYPAGATTDCLGVFTMTLPAGQHELLVEAQGYQSRQVVISATHNISTVVTLTPTWDYQVIDSRTGGVDFQWIDATGGTRRDLADDDAILVGLNGRAFAFYGQSYTELTVSSNGFVSFGSRFTRFHGVIPFVGPPNNAIYAYAEDLNPEAGRIYGTGYDNGIYILPHEDRLVVQYNEVEHWSQGDPETFQLILDTSTDEITLQYHTVSWPDFTTVGMENASGDQGIAYSYANSAGLESGLAVRFRPVFGQEGLVCPQ